MYNRWCIDILYVSKTIRRVLVETRGDTMGKGLDGSAARLVKGSTEGAVRVEEDVWIPSICESQCADAPCLLRVHRVNGVAVGVEPNTEIEGYEQLAKNRGRLCPKAYGVIQKLYNPHRIKGPLKRTNPKKGRGVDPQWIRSEKTC
jgi:anaerobic selenocysteine-containing dehydrogenase